MLCSILSRASKKNATEENKSLLCVVNEVNEANVVNEANEAKVAKVANETNKPRALNSKSRKRIGGDCYQQGHFKKNS